MRLWCKSWGPVARPSPDLPPRDAVLALISADGRLAVHVVPGARTESLTLAEGGLVAKVRAKPEDGKATAAVRDLLATALGLAPSRLELLRGATSREKLFQVKR